MTEFGVNSSVSLSVGTTAQDFVVPSTQNAESSDSNTTRVRHASHVKLVNTHASNNLFLKRNGVATTSDFDLLVPSGQEEVISIGNLDRVSIIASGASTTGVLQWGSRL